MSMGLCWGTLLSLAEKIKRANRASHVLWLRVHHLDERKVRTQSAGGRSGRCGRGLRGTSRIPAAALGRTGFWRSDNAPFFLRVLVENPFGFSKRFPFLFLFFVF